MPNKIILITGINGFIGKALAKTLSNYGFEVRGTVRSDSAFQSMTEFINQFHLKKISLYNLGELTHKTEWSKVLGNIDIIIHCAARAHILQETNGDPINAFRQINFYATQHLAQVAITHNVRRIIFISSIGVLGNNSTIPFTDDSKPNPSLPYAQSKLEAEQCLIQLSKNIEVVIIRPPLVYGPGVKGNFKKLLNLIEKGLPLPLGHVKNKRQFIGIDNLVDFIMKCILSSNAANQTFLIADKEVISTTQLLKTLSKLMKKHMLLLPIPSQLLKSFLHIIGKKKIADQLLNNLEINFYNAKKLLDWEPPYTMTEQLQKTIEEHYRNKKNR
jgi:nucleoside-diphosphate-sugar epimerase